MLIKGVIDMPGHNRTVGADLKDNDAERILDDHISAAHLRPKELLKCKLQPAKGYTSDWPAGQKITTSS